MNEKHFTYGRVSVELEWCGNSGLIRYYSGNRFLGLDIVDRYSQWEKQAKKTIIYLLESSLPVLSDRELKEMAASSELYKIYSKRNNKKKIKEVRHRIEIVSLKRKAMCKLSKEINEFLVNDSELKLNNQGRILLTVLTYKSNLSWDLFNCHFGGESIKISQRYAFRLLSINDATHIKSIIAKYKSANNQNPTSRFDILKRDNYACQICGRTFQEDGVKLEIDHKIPKSKGGLDTLDNLWTLCFSCNRGKSDKDL